MQYRICEKGIIRVVGLRMPLVEEHEVNMLMISKFWQRTIRTEHFQKICDLADQEPSGILGISAYFDPQHIYYYIAVATTQPVPVGLEEFFIPAATWCVVTCNPCSSVTVEDLLRGFCMEFLPLSGFEYAELPDIEVYPVTGMGVGTSLREAWFAVKPAGR